MRGVHSQDAENMHVPCLCGHLYKDHQGTWNRRHEDHCMYEGCFCCRFRPTVRMKGVKSLGRLPNVPYTNTNDHPLRDALFKKYGFRPMGEKSA